MPEQITSYCPSCRWTGLVTVSTGSCPVCHAPLQTVFNLPPGKALPAIPSTKKKVYYVGPDREFARLLDALFTDRGYNFESGTTYSAAKFDLILIDRRRTNWVGLVHHCININRTPVWVVFDPPGNLGEENRQAQVVHDAGAVTYLRRLYDADIVGEDLDVALEVTFPSANAATPESVQPRLL